MLGWGEGDRVLGAPGGLQGIEPCFLLQHKRETLQMTKYVELVIVADNREVRA